MKRLLVLLVSLTLLSFGSDTVNTVVVGITSKSTLRIVGKTNVNTFTCDYDIADLSDPHRIAYHGHGKHVKFDAATLILNNKNFDCGGKAINKDFHKLLRTEEHPYITLELKKLDGDQATPNDFTATVEIEIVDKSNTYEIPVKVDKQADYHVTGSLMVDLNDYGIEPPTKVMGMIKVKDEIDIQFDLYLQHLNKPNR
ncbi:YceI family protein [Robertkochia solimangrovi]|uniref:YceI family protein n=1 Tax=Robertkochia solimangrovi TaxID=2213046 RepID=UPI00117E768B|nr:YceI family protein [Robertkochia solimangrovi]TRZ46184.1 hypothetical protein DMZ48_02690 [Robertkochia solimangrovi]